LSSSWTKEYSFSIPSVISNSYLYKTSVQAEIVKAQEAIFISKFFSSVVKFFSSVANFTSFQESFFKENELSQLSDKTISQELV
jgi:hypothetical protein